MQQFTGKTELLKITTKKRIYLWIQHYGFIVVTKKALSDMLKNLKNITGYYEIYEYFIRIGLNDPTKKG